MTIGLSPSNKAASFLPLVASRKPDPELSFLEGVRQKYASEVLLEPNPVSSNTLIEISGKVVEEVGFDKVRQQLSKLDGLRNIILTGQRVGLASKQGEGDIASVCPNIELIDLTRNLINNFYDIVTICKGLPRLRTLKLKYVTITFHCLLIADYYFTVRIDSWILDRTDQTTLLCWLSRKCVNLASHFPR